jgi:hypothetical protein
MIVQPWCKALVGILLVGFNSRSERCLTSIEHLEREGVNKYSEARPGAGYTPIINALPVTLHRTQHFILYKDAYDIINEESRPLDRHKYEIP